MVWEGARRKQVATVFHLSVARLYIAALPSCFYIYSGYRIIIMQQTSDEVIEEEIEEAISIAEEEILHDIRSAYTEASKAKQKKANVILMEIMAIHDTTEEDEDDKSLAIFAKVLKLETALGIC